MSRLRPVLIIENGSNDKFWGMFVFEPGIDRHLLYAVLGIGTSILWFEIDFIWDSHQLAQRRNLLYSVPTANRSKNVRLLKLLYERFRFNWTKTCRFGQSITTRQKRFTIPVSLQYIAGEYIPIMQIKEWTLRSTKLANIHISNSKCKMKRQKTIDCTLQHNGLAKAQLSSLRLPMWQELERVRQPFHLRKFLIVNIFLS